MSLSTLSYTKDWTNAEDFPTVQTDENQVRADQQFLFNEIKAYLNDTLIPGIESAIAIACQGLVVGQLTAGSVTKDKLSAAVIEVLSRAELGGDLDTRINAVSSGKVSRTGDTMTGNLVINKQAPRIYLNRADGGSLFLECSGNDAYVISSEDGSVDNYRAIRLRNAVGESDADQALHFISRVNGAVSDRQILHTGNLSDLGVARIATGSYVGTGTYGESNPNSLTLPFEPKLLMIAPAAYGINFEDTNGSTFFHESAIWFAGTTKLLYRDSDTYYNTATCTFSVSGNTVSWYSNTANGLARTQLNTSGKEYAYFAIG